MDTRTFTLGTKMTLTIPVIAIKAMDVQPVGKNAFVAHVVINAGGLGSLRARLDASRILDSTEHDLDEATRWLTHPVFCGTASVPVLSFTRLSPGGDDAGGAPTPTPAGPGMEIK